MFNPQLRAQLIPQHERFRALTAKTSLKVNSKHHGTANEVLNIIAMLMCVDNPDPKMLSQAKTFVYNRVRQGKNLNEIMRWFGVGALVPLVDWRWRTQYVPLHDLPLRSITDRSFQVVAHRDRQPHGRFTSRPRERG